VRAFLSNGAIEGMRIYMKLRRAFREHTRKAAALTLALILASGCIIAVARAAQKADISALSPQAIEISARPFVFDRSDSARRDFGRLEWYGGLILSARSEFFGGYSDMAISADDDALLAISDSGSWLSARLTTKNGQLTGISDGRIGPLPQKDGRPLQRRSDRDAESLVALDRSGIEGRYLIGFESRHRIDEYAFEKGKFRGPVGSRVLPRELRRMGRNEGLEGMALLRGGDHKGALVAFSEHKLDRENDHSGALMKADKSYPLFLKRSGEFNITSLQSLSDGSLLVLERSFIRASLKLDTRLRLIKAADIKPGARLDGEVLLEAGSRYMIDNFEGMAVTETKKGETIITLISDDNFNFFQSTLLARFKLK
jgi:hypothetical protein